MTLQPVEQSTEGVRTESNRSDAQEVVDDLRLKLSATEQEAFSSRCRYQTVLYSHTR